MRERKGKNGIGVKERLACKKRVRRPSNSENEKREKQILTEGKENNNGDEKK